MEFHEYCDQVISEYTKTLSILNRESGNKSTIRFIKDKTLEYQTARRIYEQFKGLN